MLAFLNLFESIEAKGKASEPESEPEPHHFVFGSESSKFQPSLHVATSQAKMVRAVRHRGKTTIYGSPLSCIFPPLLVAQV
jgi:hypothetical protein